MAESLAEALARLEHELRTQDNRFTADPIFMVQELCRTYGIDPQWDPANRRGRRAHLQARSNEWTHSMNKRY